MIAWIDLHAHPGRCVLDGLGASDPLVGLLGPREMPQAIRDRIAADIREVVGDPEVESKLSATGQVVNPGSPAEFAVALDDQRAVVKKIGETLDIKPAQ